MKNTRTLRRAIGLAAIIALIGIAATSCDSPSGAGAVAGPGETAVYHTVTFYTGLGGSAVPSARVRDGNTVARPTNDPTRGDYYFTHWGFNFNQPITSNITVPAMWELRQGGLRFRYNASLQGYEAVGLVDADAAISVVIPSTLGGDRPVVGIASGAFSNSGIIGLTFEQNSQLEVIGTSAFSGTASLASAVEIPASVATINWAAFRDSGITGLTFAQNSQLEYIEGWAFNNTASLTGTVEIPASVVTIGASAFSGSSITGLTFAQNSQLEYIEGWAFNNTASLTGTVEIPAGVVTIGYAAFASSAIELTFENGSQLETIGGFAFSGALTGTVEIPASVVTIGEFAFQASGITGLTFAQNSKLETFGYRAFVNTGFLTGTVEIPANVVTIGANAFSNSRITGLTFEQGSQLETIGNEAFMHTGSFGNLASTVEIPPSVESIGENAFAAALFIETIRIQRDTLYPAGWGELWHGNRPVYNSLVSPPERLN